MPFLLILGAGAILGAGGLYIVSDTTEKFIKLAIIGGVVYFVVATPTGRKLVKAVF